MRSLRRAASRVESADEIFLSSNGNVRAELFKGIAPLKVNGKLVGNVALGPAKAMPCSTTKNWEPSILLCNYVAIAIQNHVLSQTLATACF